jgi:hypothetical protein
MRILPFLLLLFALSLQSSAESADYPPGSTEAIFPPAQPWKGKSMSLVVGRSHRWITPAEASHFRTTPGYEETGRWLRRLAAAAPEIQITSIGRSHEGRDIWMVVASKEGGRSPRELRATGKPLLLVQAGIHSGEIDGKDAGMMLLRDLTVAGRQSRLLEKVNLLFVPILNVDGHERSSPYNRINQRGPENMGWRTNARNLNLNRDYTKLDTPEIRAMIEVINSWKPDLYLDIHVTDGVDYQYDITWGGQPGPGYSPAAARWIVERFTPEAVRSLREQDHIPGPLIFATNNEDFAGGIAHIFSNPRFSNAYGDARHLPTILVENHSLKPYRQRVLGTYVLLASAMKILGAEEASLRTAAAADRALRPSPVPIAWAASDEVSKIRLEAIESRRVPSPITGTTVVQWTGRPVSVEVPAVDFKPVVLVPRAAAYWIPAAWNDVIERVALHGINVERILEKRSVEVEMYRLMEPKLEPDPVEGRPRVRATTAAERRTETYAPGSARISTDQPLGDLAALLLEPASSDSFFQWGFFLEVLQKTEYVEGYILAPMAERMLRENPDLAREFYARVENDATFRDDPEARLEWFYERSPFHDSRWRLYPVARELIPVDVASAAAGH